MILPSLLCLTGSFHSFEGLPWSYLALLQGEPYLSFLVKTPDPLGGPVLMLRWAAGGLETASDLAGPWLPVAGAVSPQSIAVEAEAGGPARFYRLRK